MKNNKHAIPLLFKFNPIKNIKIKKKKNKIHKCKKKKILTKKTQPAQN